MTAPSAVPLVGAPLRVIRFTGGTSAATQHLARHQPLRFGDSPHIRAMLEKPTWSVRSLMPKELRDNRKNIGLVERRLAAAAAGTKTGYEEQRRGAENASGQEATEGQDRVEAKAKAEVEGSGSNEDITPSKLHHLLRLSALPPPKDIDEENRMLRDLRNQIHFVKQIQTVDTEGVEPLVAIRDETAEHIESMTATLEGLRPWLDMEEKVGKGEFVRVSRPRDVKVEEMGWDPFEMGVGCGEGGGGGSGSGRRWGRYFVVKKGRKGVRPGKGREMKEGG